MIKTVRLTAFSFAAVLVPLGLLVSAGLIPGQ
jgi:hypothetical protein